MDANQLSDGGIILSPLVMDDAVEWLAGQDDEQIRWFEFPRPAELSDVQRFISGTIESWNSSDGHWYWGIRTTQSPSIVGGVDLRDFGGGEFNLSYVIFPLFRHLGFAKRASVLALKYARDTLAARSVVIKMLADNEYSVKVAESLGAELVGTEPSDTGGDYRVFRLILNDLRKTSVEDNHDA
jgi:RimJ/RimL family protein N-acetyltransferase